MRSTDNIRKTIKNTKIKTNPEVSKTVLNDLLDRMDRAESVKTNAHQPNTWRIIMQSKITKFATAAVIILVGMIIVNQFGGSIDGASVAWAEIVQRLELSYNQYYDDLLLAVEEKDLEKTTSNADSLSEFWQGIHILAEAKLDPAISLESEDSLNLIKRTFGKYHYDIDKDTFQNYANEFLDWFDRIEDEIWIYDIIHISKEMEEYAEEIRDAGTGSRPDISYAEHCMHGFVRYSEWFKQLPWDNPKQIMMPAVVLKAIERDLTIARREIEAIQRGDADRVAKRCMLQAARNSTALEKRIKSGQMPNQWKLAHKLNKKVNELSGLIAYLTVAARDISLSNKYHNDEAVYQTLKTEFANKDSFADYFIEQVDQALDLCGQLQEGFEYTQ